MNQCEICGTYCTVSYPGDICERCAYVEEVRLVQSTTRLEQERIRDAQPAVEWRERDLDWRGQDYV